MSLGAGALKVGGAGQQSGKGEGDNHGNPASGHHQRHHHTEPVTGILTKHDTYQREGGEEKAWN